MTPWWVGVPPAEARVRCGGHVHRLRFAEGALHAPDHDDPEAERTLGALGGESPTCIDVLDAWARHTGDLAVLTLASRGPSDPLQVDSEWAPNPPAQPPGGRGRGGWSRYPLPRSTTRAFSSVSLRAVSRGAAMAPEDERVQLLGLGGALPNRLAATVIAESLGRLDDPSQEGARARSHLTAALYGRATAALRAWTSQADLDVDLVVAASAEDAQLRETDTGLRAELPLSWLRDAWAREAATVWGRFCIAATADRGTLSLSTIGPDLGAVEIVTIALT